MNNEQMSIDDPENAYTYLSELLEAAESMKWTVMNFADRYQAIKPELLAQLRPSEDRWKKATASFKELESALAKFDTDYNAASGCNERHEVVTQFLGKSFWQLQDVDI